MNKFDPTMLGFRRVGGASLRLRVPQSLPKHMHDKMREIIDVKTDPTLRKRGYATSLMHSVCREADKTTRILLLYPKAFEYGDAPIGLADQQLMDWYSRSFGFQAIQANPVLMARMVGATPQASLKLNPATEAIYLTGQKHV